MNHRANHRTLVFSFLIVIVALGVVTPALADYIGPNRTVTETVNVCHISLNECQFVESKNEWRYKQVDTWSCSNESKPWQAYSSNSRPCNDTLHTNGYQYWERDESTRTETNTYPPATINSSLTNCTLQNGWCITAPHLSLSGSEPVAGYNIFSIEGTLNGQTFGCMSSSCNVPLSQGINSFAYWALSSFGDSSLMGTFTAKVDSVLPNISGTFSGTAGSNGWYTSSVSFNGSASDAASGLASFTCSLDGIPLGSCNTITVSNDGLHTLVLTARDNAGHSRVITQNASVDTQNPELNASISGTLGSNDWYTDALLSATALDPAPGSGLSILEYRLDGGTWIAFPVSGTLNLMDGNHTVELRAVDRAGRAVSSSKTFSLDTTPPDISLDASGTIGLNYWYTTNPVLTAVSFDASSGVDVFDYSLNGSEWQTYTAPLTLDDGIQTVSLWAQDTAGLVTQIDRTYQVDTRLPQIAGSLSGTPGMNDWYISPVTLSASASDPLPASGIDTLTYILNGNTAILYEEPLLLSDGRHTVQFRAADKAGLSYSIEQTIKVDTIQPSLQMTTTLPVWAKSVISLSGTAGDDGSGLSKVEISTDGGQTWLNTISPEPNTWNHSWNTLESTNGVHQVTIRAIDLAGLTTQQIFKIGVDNHAPEIILPESWFQWDNVTLDIVDHDSGLSEASVEIYDPKERWPKRVIQLDPNQFPLKFKWDRRFGDNTLAEPGTYEASVIAYDRMGNTTTKKASIKILIDILPAGPTSTPYVRANPTHTATALPTVTITPSPIATQTAIVSVFGAIEPTKSITPTPQILPTPRATPTKTTVFDWLQSFFVPNANQESVTELGLSDGSTETPQPQAAGTENSGVLWGTAATAAIAAATAYIQEEKRKREEEKARQAELEAEEQERREKKKERKIKKMEEKRAQEEAWEEARIEQETLEAFEGLASSGRYKDKLTDWEMQEEAIWEASQAEIRQKYEDKKKAEESKKLQDLQAGLEAYYNGRKEGEKIVATPPKEKKWWEKAVDWVDEHQTELALAVGVVAGVGAIVLSGGIAAPAVAAAWVAGAAVIAGGTVAAGTIALNAHYDRPWHTNLLKNVSLAGGAAVAVAGAGFAYSALAASGATYCSMNPATCQLVSPALKLVDTVEQTWLQAKLTYHTWKGDQDEAAEIALEIHTELMDGGMPGNSVFKEMREQITDLNKNALPLIKKYGDAVIPLLAKHGDEGLGLLQKHGDAAFELLHRDGLYQINIDEAKKLLDDLDKDALDYAFQQGPDAVAALSRWSAEELHLHGLELAQRAKKDAEVLADVKELFRLGTIDPDKLTTEQKALIEAIAANSTQLPDADRAVLGKWVDISSGFVETAQETGSLHYNPHPEMWNMLSGLGKANQEEVAWLINQQVVQKGIKDKLPFEYTLNGIATKNIENEEKAVEAIFAGADETEIMKILKTDKIPIRMKELQELEKAGYKIVFDDISNSFILSPGKESSNE